MTKCPVCGKVLEEPGFVFGKLEQKCYTCTCGASVIVATDQTARALKEELKKGKGR